MVAFAEKWEQFCHFHTCSIEVKVQVNSQKRYSFAEQVIWKPLCCNGNTVSHQTKWMWLMMENTHIHKSKYPLPLFLFSTPLCCSDTGNDWEVWLHNGLQYRLYLHRRDLPHCAQERWHGNVLLCCTHWQYHSPICHLFRYVNADWSVAQAKIPNNVFAPGCPKWSYYHQNVDCHRVPFIAFAHKDISTLTWLKHCMYLKESSA